MSTRKAAFQPVAFAGVKYLYVEGEWPLIWPQSPVQVETHTLASDGSFYCWKRAKLYNVGYGEMLAVTVGGIIGKVLMLYSLKIHWQTATCRNWPGAPLTKTRGQFWENYAITNQRILKRLWKLDLTSGRYFGPREAGSGKWKCDVYVGVTRVHLSIYLIGDFQIKS